jgi:hypothetical protein
MHNVTLRRVRTTTVAVEKQFVTYKVCTCSDRYPACNAHVPYCHLWLTRLYNIFLRYLIKRHDLKETVTEHKICI